MTEEEALKRLDELVQVARESSVTMLLNMLSKHMSMYHAHGEDSSLIMMNYCMMILLIKQGLFDVERTVHDIKTVLRERELVDFINQCKS